LSEFILARLAHAPHRIGAGPPPGHHVLSCDDAQLALYLAYELHYQGLPGVDDGWEWEPGLLTFRRGLEDRFLDELLDLAGPRWSAAGAAIDEVLHSIIDAATGPSLSRHMEREGTLEQMREFAVHRSAWQLREADGHTWGIPRLSGRAKAAMVEIQSDEYGGGREAAMHSVLFAETMSALGLNPAYGTYVDLLPGATLATTNLVSFFGLHRRWRGALVGHLATFEMTSVEPMARYSAALSRLGLPDAARHFYDVHVEADAHHQVVAARDLAGGLAAQEPDLVDDIAFGARALMAVEERFARHLLSRWDEGCTSLLSPLPDLQEAA
jgi:hypothetical protein